MFPEFQTRRFLFRQIVLEDKPFIFEGLSHPLVIPHYGVEYKTLEETSLQMHYYNQLWNQHTGAWWKIVDKETFEKLGAVGYNNYSAPHKKCEIGYWLLPQHWHKGIISEALAQMIPYLFNEMKMHRIEALIEEGNEPSCKVVEKAGFTLEGTLRDYEEKNNRYISLRMYSLLTQDVKTV